MRAVAKRSMAISISQGGSVNGGVGRVIGPPMNRAGGGDHAEVGGGHGFAFAIFGVAVHEKEVAPFVVEDGVVLREL